MVVCLTSLKNRPPGSELVEQAPANHHVLNFGGAVDVVSETGCCQMTRKRVVPPCPVRAHDLHAIGQSLFDGASGELLCVGGRNRSVLAVLNLAGSSVGQQARRLEVGRDVSQHEMHGLKIGDSAAKGLPILDAFGCCFEASAKHPA